MMAVLAHMGGIDEIALFVLPAVAVILLLRRAERRAREEGEEASAVESDPDSEDLAR